jgi:allantoinase
MENGAGYEIIDVGNKAVMPGVIDPHVHINEPGRTEWEGFETAAKAALAGGLTTLVDMPLNSSPVTTTVKAFEEKLAAAKNKLHTNVGFWGGVVPGNANETEGLIDKGVLGFKAFLTHSGIDDFPNATEDDLRKVMPIIARHKLPLLVHCELETDHRPPTIDDRSKTNNNDGRSSVVGGRSYNNYLASRPKDWEDEAIALMIRLCEEYDCRVHIVHLSSANSIEQIRRAKERGLPLTIETAQHYLFFNAEDIGDGQTQFKCAPPIREKANNDLLWQALKDGTIDFVATDHSPAPPEMKQLQTGDFMKAWGGIASLQFALPVLWTAARKRDIQLDHIAKWLCEAPAKLAGINKKGKLAQGYDADIIIWDADKEFTVTEDMIHHKHKVTPYLNQQLFGVVGQTFLSGVKVYDNGSFTKLNSGKIITRNNG